MSPYFIAVRCASHRKPFIVRFRKRGASTWIYENATEIPEHKVGGGDIIDLRGGFEEGPEYPGCPHCHSAPSFFLCSCGRLTCWDGSAQQVTCGWCKQSGRIGGQVDRLSGRSG